jgi:hypothetical protein
MKNTQISTLAMMTVVLAFGLIGGCDYALKFDGQTSPVVIPGLHYEGGHPITFEAWVQPEDLSSKRAILCDFQHAGIGLEFHDGRCGFLIHNGQRYVCAWANEPSVIGEEIHIAGVFDGEHLKLFINGRMQMAPTPFEGRPNPSELQPMIGANPEHKGHNNTFNGWIDEVRISRIARYADTFTPQRRFEPDEHTIALYHFDEGRGCIVHDSSGNKQQGRMLGTVWVVNRTTRETRYGH